MSTELLELLTGGEAVAHAMRQIDPDVVPVYPITPQTPIIQGFAKFVGGREGAQRARRRRVGALGDERCDRLGARRRADDDRHLLAGPRADGGGRLHRGRDARPDRDGGRQPRPLGADQHPLRPLRLDADPRLGRRPAVRRERAGGLRPDRARRPGWPSTPTCCCPCSSAWTASRSRTPPSRSSCWRTRTSPVRRRVRDPQSAARHRAADDAGAVRDAGLLLRAAAPADRRAGGRARRLAERSRWTSSSSRAAGTARSRATGSTARSACSSRSARRQGRSRTSSTSCATEGEPVGLLKIVSFRPFPQALVAELLHDVESVIVLDRAASPGGAAPLRAEVAAALTGNRVDAPRLRPRRARPPSGGRPRHLRRARRRLRRPAR